MLYEPRRIELELSSYCNAKCISCTRIQIDGDTGLLYQNPYTVLNKNLDLFNNISNVKIIDPLDKLLQDKNNFIDYLHLTPQGNNILASEIFKVINKNL